MLNDRNREFSNEELFDKKCLCDNLSFNDAASRRVT